MQKVLIPDDLHRELKIEAAKRGTTIQEAAAGALWRFVRGDQDEQRQRSATNGASVASETPQA